MAQNAIVQSIKTITESLIRKAGFDKTRSGKVVGVNSLTNTYSVKVDGHTYNNVRVVNDATYNVGDTVKVNIPVNQMSQAYISASIFSDESIGKKIGHAESLINAIDGTLEDIKEIDGHIYQLDIVSVYGLRDPDNKEYSTHTGHIYKDGVDVTSATYWNRFRWYLMTSTGKEIQTSDVEDDTLTLPIAKYLYGMVLILEWVDENEGVILRKQTTLIDNSEIASVETTASNAYELADNTDNYFWNVESGTDTGAHITRVPKDTFIAAITDAERGYNLLAKPQGVALRYGYSELAQFTYDKLTFNALNNGVLNKNMELTPNSLTFYDGTTSGIELAKFNSSGMVLKNSSGYKTTESGNNGFVLYDGTSSENELASFRSSGSVIGKDGETRLIMDFHSLKMKDSNDITYFDVEDLRDAQGEFSLTRNFVGDGVTDVFMLTSDLISRIESITSVEIDSVTMPSTDYTLRAIDFDYYIDFNNPPSDGSNIKVVCITKNATAKVYTAGVRAGNNIADYGCMSFAEGYITKASGDASHAEGYSSEATSFCSHAEGFVTKAYGDASHAEGSETRAYGNYSHSEGFLTKAYREYSHAEGDETTAYGVASHSSGLLTTAAGLGQTVIGMYNKYDDGAFTKTTDTSISSSKNYYAVDQFGIMRLVQNPDVSDIQNYYELDDLNAKYAFIIGNGASSPSNALTVDWDGNVNASGSFYGNIPSAKFYGGASGNLSVTSGNFYALNQFPGWSHGTNIYDSNVFADDNNGLTLKKSGVYYFSAQAHFNASASGDWIMMHLYDYDAQTVLSGATYGYQNNGFCDIWLNEIVNVTALNHRIILRYGRYSGSADFRPTWVRLNAILLKPTS